jgi:hypothetical protein
MVLDSEVSHNPLDGLSLQRGATLHDDIQVLTGFSGIYPSHKKLCNNNLFN